MEKNIYTKEELYWCGGGKGGELPRRITPSYVNVLEENEIFVFGSNVQGLHAGGAAWVAMKKFGAIWGQGEGLQGNSYALPTMEGTVNMRKAVERFVKFAKEHSELKFFVTPIGCGIAGYNAEDVAPFFKEAVSLENVYMPLSFWKVLLKELKKD